MKSKEVNYKLFLLANIIFSIGLGIFYPFWILYIQKIGGSLESFSIAVGLSIMASAISAYFFGSVSDKSGRKPIFIISGYSLAVIIFLYTFVSNVWQLYVLQIVQGILQTAYIMMESVFLADITQKSTRGKNIGFYNMIIGIITALSVILSGFLISEQYFKGIFYVVSILILISTTIMIKLKE